MIKPPDHHAIHESNHCRRMSAPFKTLCQPPSLPHQNKQYPAHPTFNVSIHCLYTSTTPCSYSFTSHSEQQAAPPTDLRAAAAAAPAAVATCHHLPGDAPRQPPTLPSLLTLNLSPEPRIPCPPNTLHSPHAPLAVTSPHQPAPFNTCTHTATMVAGVECPLAGACGQPGACLGRVACLGTLGWPHAACTWGLLGLAA